MGRWNRKKGGRNSEIGENEIRACRIERTVEDRDAVGENEEG